MVKQKLKELPHAPNKRKGNTTLLGLGLKRDTEVDCPYIGDLLEELFVPCTDKPRVAW